MNKLGNYITGRWITGDGDGQVLYDAVTGDDIAIATTEGLDFASILDYGRRVGNPALRRLTFHERGRMLRALAMHLNEIIEKFYASAIKQAQQKQIAGLILKAALEIYFAYASLRRKFPDVHIAADGEPANLSKNGYIHGASYFSAERRCGYSYQCI